MKLYALFLSMPPVSQALVTHRRHQETDSVLAGFGVHTEFTLPDTGHAIQMHVEGYTGPVHFMDSSDTPFVPSQHFKLPWERNLTSTLEKRNVCEYIANCVTDGVVDVAVWTIEKTALGTAFCINIANSMNNYLTNNNYANAHAILLGSVITVFWTLGLTPVQYYMNAKLDVFTGKSGTDSCGIKDPETFSGNAASAVYEYCLSTQDVITRGKIATRYSAADLASADAKDFEGGGNEALLEFFIAQQAAVFAPICRDMGIVWKRSAQGDGDGQGHVVRKAIGAS